MLYIPLATDPVVGGEEVLNSMGSLGTLFTQFTSWMTEMVTTITKTGNEILLLAVGIFAVGAVIGLARRLIGG